MLKKYDFSKASGNPYIREMEHLLSDNVDELIKGYLIQQASELKIPRDLLTSVYITEIQKKEQHKARERSKKRGLYR